VTLSRLRTVAVVAQVLVCGACSSSGGGTGGTANEPTTSATHPVKLVVMGSDLALGDSLDDSLRDAWPRLLFRSLPTGSSFVNAATDRATLADALQDQVPIVEEARPDIVVLLLGSDDVIERTPLTTFRRQFAELLARAVARSGRVLVGNLPAIGVDHTEVDPYNAAIADVAGTYHVQLVDLSQVQGQNADRPQHRSIAAAFEAAFARG
jgi:lysophospholipase L1-like esterase